MRSFSVHKPGATVCLKVDEVISAFFRWADCGLPDYSYNTPPDRFDQTVLNVPKKRGQNYSNLLASSKRASRRTPCG